MPNSIWIGFDPREASAYAVCRSSLNYHLTQAIPVRGVILEELQRLGLYTRPLEYRRSSLDVPIMWDTISGATMSTQHANARFLVPHLANPGWALFCDGDMLFRGNVARLFESLDKSVPLYCVKHNYAPVNQTKMDGQVQTVYPRKNWSSFMIFNVGHPANEGLTLEAINSLPGRDLHRFCWLDDSEIGALPDSWNFLVGYSEMSVPEVKCVHFTEGVPDMPGYENVPFADEWRAELIRWAK